MCSIFSTRKQSRLSSFIDLRFRTSIAFLPIREEFITLNTQYVNTKSVVNQLKVLQICHISNYCTTNSLCHIRRLYSLSVAKFHISVSNSFLAIPIKLQVPENLRMDSTFWFYDLQSTVASSNTTPC
jgi:hypothetical protein